MLLSPASPPSARLFLKKAGVPVLWLALLCCAPLGTGCQDETTGNTAQAADGSIQRSQDPRLLDARAALKAGRPSAAESTLNNLGDQAGVEGPLCLAQAYLMMGRVMDALTQVERARALHANDPRVFATSAQILALQGNTADARDEIQSGRVFSPNSPDLLRAKAFLHLTQPGEGERALECLQKALSVDPKTPYVDWPMAQAYLLTGRAELGRSDLAGAVVSARAALKLEPELAEAEELLGAALASLNDFEGALAAYGRASQMGLEIDHEVMEVHLRAAMNARMAFDHTTAEEHYLKARELGARDIELSSGKDYLIGRARVAFEDAMTAKLRGDESAASAQFAHSVRLAPNGPLALDALDGQAGARFRLADYLGAALLWKDVQAREYASLQPDLSRTHLNLARAYVLSGQLVEARECLDTYLKRFPGGDAAQETQELLAVIPEN